MADSDWMIDFFFFSPSPGGILLQDHCLCDRSTPGASDRCSVDTEVDLYSFLIFLHLFSAWFSSVLGRGGEKKYSSWLPLKSLFQRLLSSSGIQRWAVLYILLREHWNQFRMIAARSERERAGYPCRNCTTDITHRALSCTKTPEKAPRLSFIPELLKSLTHTLRSAAQPPRGDPGLFELKLCTGGYRQR